MHEMEMRIETPAFKNPLRGFGTETHMNNTPKILQRKPGRLYSCQILALSLILLRLQLLTPRPGHTQGSEAFPSAAPTLLSATLEVIHGRK